MYVEEGIYCRQTKKFKK